jgi:predicted aspartyl protease
VQVKDKGPMVDAAGRPLKVKYVLIPKMVVGTITMTDVDGIILDTGDPTVISLLGRSFLDRLSHWESSGNTLTMKE